MLWELVKFFGRLALFAGVYGVGVVIYLVADTEVFKPWTNEALRNEWRWVLTGKIQ